MFRLFDKVENDEVYVIAEMSANHGGSLDNALKLVREAALAGADCVKTQTYTADTLTLDCDGDHFRLKGGLWDGKILYDLYSAALTPWEWQSEIRSECERQGIDFFSSPFDRTAVDFLEGIGCEAYKIASFELVDIPLIRCAASTGKPVIMSTGMATEEEIGKAVQTCIDAGNHRIAILKCLSEYPADPSAMNLRTIPHMMDTFHIPVGLSDHSPGSVSDVAAVALGARVIEKHLMLPGVESADSAFSMSPEEFSRMVSDVRTAVKALGRVSYGCSGKETTELRRSLFASRDIKKGELFTEENVKSVRPSCGLPPECMDQLINKAARRDIPFGAPLEKGDLEGL